MLLTVVYREACLQRLSWSSRVIENINTISSLMNHLSRTGVNQDKLQTLANWLSVDIHWLRFGNDVPVNHIPPLSTEQQNLVKNFALLSPIHQKIVLDLVNSLVETY